MPELKLRKRYKYAGDVFEELLKFGFDLSAAEELVNNIPDANVIEVQCGHWEITSGGKHYCSACGAREGFRIFCGHCGTKMGLAPDTNVGGKMDGKGEEE